MQRGEALGIVAQREGQGSCAFIHEAGALERVERHEEALPHGRVAAGDEPGDGGAEGGEGAPRWRSRLLEIRPVSTRDGFA